jgi:S-adenosylmethionine:tRNA ribosyltransferase-isomerase
MHDTDILELVGRTPLPPYIVRARKHSGQAENQSYDKDRYQTVYAHDETKQPQVDAASHLQTAQGSVAAPTAGLHLTPQLLADIETLGVSREEVTLHVGLGTFKSVESEFVEQHAMHSERCMMSSRVREAIVRTRAARNRVLCVGTTATRTVESYAQLDAKGQATDDWLDTNILITPGYQWRWTDAMITNFHLPKSTLMAMIASLLGDASGKTGVQRLKQYYEVALTEGYRFYSYGDAMCILE